MYSNYRDILHRVFAHLPSLRHIKFLRWIFVGDVFEIETGFIGILDATMPLLDTLKIFV
jgi:hypothetical protein